MKQRLQEIWVEPLDGKRPDVVDGVELGVVVVVNGDGVRGRAFEEQAGVYALVCARLFWGCKSFNLDR